MAAETFATTSRRRRRRLNWLPRLGIGFLGRRWARRLWLETRKGVLFINPDIILGMHGANCVDKTPPPLSPERILFTIYNMSLSLCLRVCTCLYISPVYVICLRNGTDVCVCSCCLSNYAHIAHRSIRRMHLSAASLSLFALLCCPGCCSFNYRHSIIINGIRLPQAYGCIINTPFSRCARTIVQRVSSPICQRSTPPLRRRPRPRPTTTDIPGKQYAIN